jgi:hypothetical protein
MKITCSLHPIREIHATNLLTMGKTPKGDLPFGPDLMLAEHSTLEFTDITIEDDVRGDVIHQITRHTKGHPRFAVQSSRPDWTGKERPPASTPRKFKMKANPIALMAMARQRLCFKAMKETREWMERLKANLYEEGDRLAELTDDDSSDYLTALSWAMVPECVYRAGCPYGSKSCGFYKKFHQSDSIEGRYGQYNLYFWRMND